MRLALADWLEEHGEAERAECLRLHTRLGGRFSWSRPTQVTARVAALEGEHGPGWLQGLLEGAYLAGGLAVGLKVLGLNWEAELERACRTFDVQELDLKENKIGDAGAAALAASPHLGQLTSLDLSSNKIGDAGAAALVASPRLGQLTSLDLGCNQIGAEGAKALAASSHLGQLTYFDLWDNEIEDAGAAALAASAHLGQLTSLLLGRNDIGEAGRKAIRRRWPFASL